MHEMHGSTDLKSIFALHLQNVYVIVHSAELYLVSLSLFYLNLYLSFISNTENNIQHLQFLCQQAGIYREFILRRYTADRLYIYLD